MTIQEFMWLIRNKILTIILVAVLLTAVGLALDFSKAPLYQTSVTMMVTGNQGGSLLTNQPLTKTFAEIAKSKEVAVAVAETTFNTLTSQEIQSKISIQTVPDTNLLKIIVTDVDPTRTVEIANAAAASTKTTIKKLLQEDMIKIIEKASLPLSPVQQNKGINTIAGVLLGLFVGIVFVLVRESFANHILSEEDISKKLKLSILGTIANDKALHVGKNIEFTPEQLLVSRSPKSATAHAFRKLRTNLLNLTQESKFTKPLVVTSSTFGEGTTLIAANLATSLANLGKDVILVDCNLGNGKLAEIFKLGNSKGLINYLNNKLQLEEILQESHVPGLKVITTGPAFNGADCFSHPQFTAFLEMLAQQSDMVIIDSSPVSESADALILCNIAEKVLFVIKKGTPFIKVMKSIKSLKLLNVNLLGCAFNRED